MCQDTAHAFTPSHSQTHNDEYEYNPLRKSILNKILIYYTTY